MVSRIFAPVLRAQPAAGRVATRNFMISARRAAAPVVENPLPVRKPVGAFRGG